ncbi:hypothetical protein [Methanosarcina siciliae]|uniref:hypothetical protein n=1 Tax=Methanosarcina siciliae TaxID=38027 RepID=UPI000A803581|nr:hypothetical protein [Methanosarcina siciliae]
MRSNTLHEHQEPFVVRPFVAFLDAVTDAETANDAIAIGNLSEIGYTLGTLVLKKEEGEAIRVLKKEKISAQLRVFRHYENLLRSEKIENIDFKTRKLQERDFVKYEVSKIIERYIIRICAYAFKRGPLKMVSVDKDFESKLFFENVDAVADAKAELEDFMRLYQVGI